MTLKRLLAAADRHLLRCHLPHGVISWRYLLSGQPATVRIHRHLWLLGRHPRLPLPLYFGTELLLWLRWVCFSCWRQSWRAVRRRGSEIREREGIGMTSQLRRLLALGLGHSVPPREVYAFGLYRPGTERDVWDHVFIQETPAFHRWRNAGLPDQEGSQALIQDKYRLAGLLAGQGIPTVRTLVMVPRGAPFDPAPALQQTPRLFCKPRHGSAGRDAFVVEQYDNHGQPAIFAARNGAKAQPSSFAALHAVLEQDDFLVQPLLINHPELVRLSSSADAITIRIITERDASGPRCYSATLEIPADSDEAGSYHIILPIDLASGEPQPFPEDRLPARAKAEHDAVLARIGQRSIPFWDELRSSAKAAHQYLPGLFAIAWDYVITPDGPCLLEGNSCWGATTPQLLLGGLLKKEFREH